LGENLNGAPSNRQVILNFIRKHKRSTYNKIAKRFLGDDAVETYLAK